MILQLLAAPFCVCLILAAIHCYMGLHILRRGVIFVDLALAQMAALGGTVALLLGPAVFGPAQRHHAEAAPTAQVQPAGDESESFFKEGFDYGLSLLFAFAGAALIAIGRFRDGRVPQEAIIGIVFVVSAALAVLILSKSPHGSEETEGMLIGHLLFINWGEVIGTAILYSLLAIPHIIWRRKFLLISENLAAAEAQGLSIRLWDFIFYGIFGVMVTHSVRMAGVLVVFSYLIIPAVCASIFYQDFRRSLLLGWTLALVASIAGLWFSVLFDMPTGASLVAMFGCLLVVCSALYRLFRRRLPQRT